MDGVFVSIGHDYCSGECMAFDGKVKSYEVKSGKLESYKRKGSGYTLRSNVKMSREEEKDEPEGD